MQEPLRKLDAVPDPRHPSYKVPGLLTWSILGLAVAGMLISPDLFVTGTKLFALALLARLTVTVTLYLAGMVRCHIWERRAGAGACQGSQADDSDPVTVADVHHVILIPNYKEPVEMLRRTLQNLAEWDEASRHLTVVLAMEEREALAVNKADALRSLFGNRFAHMLITIHPANRPGEIAGKGSNQAWAARQAKEELVERSGMPIEHLTLTSCDADSILHPRYFAEVGCLFAHDPERYHRFWYAPLLYRNNVWRVPALIRLMAFGAGSMRLAELAGPLSLPLPVSTYTLSFKLADEVGYWDPAVISEDWHMYLRCFFATGGRIRLKRLFLPASGDAVEGETFWQAMISFYQQQLRHAWGAQDVGYVLQQWRRWPDVPFGKKLLYFSRVTSGHLIWSTSWFILALGWFCSIQFHASSDRFLPFSATLSDPFRFLGIVWGIGSVLTWALERAQSSPNRQSWRPITLVKEIVAWLTLPMTGLLLWALPALHAQTKLLLGRQLVYQRTPKRVSQGQGKRVAPACRGRGR